MPEQLRLVTQVNSERVQKTDDGYLIRDAVPVVDDVVMNGGLYPAAEIATSYQSMSGVPAPIGHPEDETGAFISAQNGEGLRKFYAGATCENLRYVGGRVLMDVAINEAQAMAHPDGPRLIAALAGGEPVHLSTGLLLQREQRAGNSKGKDYTWVARNMQFDHVAILLDQPGAATPDDGVGMWVNVDQELSAPEPEQNTDSLLKKILDSFREIVAQGAPRGYTDPVTVINADNGGEIEMTPEEIQELVGNAVKNAVAPLADELKDVKAAMAANAEAQRSSLVEQAATATGIEANALKGMTDDGLKALIAKVGKAAGVGSDYQGNADESETYEMPE